MSRAPRLISASWDLTKRCPSQCVYCYNDSGRHSFFELPAETLLGIAHQLLEVRPESVCISGGEPLLVESFTEIVDMMSEGGSELTVITSGTAPSTSLQWVSKVDTIQLSVDSLDASINDRLRGRRGALSEAQEFALRVGERWLSKIRVASTATVLNYATLPDLVAHWIQSPAVKSVVVQPLIELGRGSRVASLKLSAAETERLRVELDAIAESCGKPITYLEDPFSQLRANRSRGAELVQCHIEANGDVTAHPLELGVIGNVAGENRLVDLLFENQGYWASRESMIHGEWSFQGLEAVEDGWGHTLSLHQPYVLHPRAKRAADSVSLGGDSYALNGTASEIVEMLREGKSTIPEIIDRLLGVYDCSASDAERDVRDLVGILVAEGLVLPA